MPKVREEQHCEVTERYQTKFHRTDGPHAIRIESILSCTYIPLGATSYQMQKGIQFSRILQLVVRATPNKANIVSYPLSSPKCPGWNQNLLRRLDD